MKKILLVDDDLKNSMLLKRFIEAEGMRLYMPLMAKWDWNYTETSIPI